jgi:hypothetical protein
LRGRFEGILAVARGLDSVSSLKVDGSH